MNDIAQGVPLKNEQVQVSPSTFSSDEDEEIIEETSAMRIR
jgi:hypothetical protein